MFFYLVAAFAFVPAIEIALFVKVGQVLGVVATVAIVLLTAVVGANLARLEGFRTLTRLQASLQRGDLPAEELLDGFIILVAGIVLVTPGFFTDACGLLLLFPPSRAVFKAWLKRRFQRGLESGRIHVAGVHMSGDGTGFSGGFQGGLGGQPWPGQGQGQRGHAEVIDVVEVREVGDGDERSGGS